MAEYVMQSSEGALAEWKDQLESTQKAHNEEVTEMTSLLRDLDQVQHVQSLQLSVLQHGAARIASLGN